MQRWVGGHHATDAGADRPKTTDRRRKVERRWKESKLDSLLSNQRSPREPRACMPTAISKGGYPPVLPLASRGALVGATPLLVTGTLACGLRLHSGAVNIEFAECSPRRIIWDSRAEPDHERQTSFSSKRRRTGSQDRAAESSPAPACPRRTCTTYMLSCIITCVTLSCFNPWT